MTSITSKIFIWTVRNRHLMKFKLKPEVVTTESDTQQMRDEFEAGAAKMGKIPETIEVTQLVIDGINAEWISPVGVNKQKVMLFNHGGGYISGNCKDHRMHVAKLVQQSGVTALLYDYRLAPEHPFPAAVEDTLKVYRWMLAQGIAAENIVVAGESAGGGLCMATLVAIRDEGLPLPAGGVASSPWLDLTCTADSYRRNERKDISTLGSWQVWNKYYFADSDPRHPWVSPLYADLKGLPPVFIQVGTHEIMLDDSVNFIEKAKTAGVDASISIWEEMVHCFAFFSPMFPEAKAGMEELCRMVRKFLRM
jgi:acetyl esterase/lipase